jgi:dephospho-CoA kinase
MLRLKKVAVTGGLSCGKSSVCRILKEFDAYVISADKIVHQLLSSDTNLGQEVIKLLGSRILVNGQIDRARVAQIVFYDEKLLEGLEDLIHPAVYNEIEKEYQKQQASNHPSSLFVAEIPLLFESGGEKYFDFIIAVVADPDLCFQRFAQATGYDEQEFERRTNRQMTLLEKAIRANYVIMNNHMLSDLKDIIKELYHELTEN